MALQGSIPVSPEPLFPYGCYVVGGISKTKDFDAKGDAQAHAGHDRPAVYRCGLSPDAGGERAHGVGPLR